MNKIIKAHRKKNTSISGFGAPKKYPQPIKKYYITQAEINDLSDGFDPHQYTILPTILETKYGRGIADKVMQEIRSRGGNNKNTQISPAKQSSALQYRVPIAKHTLVRGKSTGKFFKIVQQDELKKHGEIKTLQVNQLKFPFKGKIDPTACKTYCFKKCTTLMKETKKKKYLGLFPKNHSMHSRLPISLSGLLK